MPIMDGFEATEKILKYQKDNNLKEECKIVALTAYQTQETKNRCLNLGMLNVYHKPASKTDIKEIICLYYHRMSKNQYETFL